MNESQANRVLTCLEFAREQLGSIADERVQKALKAIEQAEEVLASSLSAGVLPLDRDEEIIETLNRR